MELDQTRVQALIDRPAETLTVELKNWIDLSEPEGQSKIVRAALALRNRNGGELVIGFDDKTLQPSTINMPADVRSSFHPDVIQGLISKYSSEIFEVIVGYGERGGILYPVVVVAPGIKTVVAAKADIRINDKHPVKYGAVYFRSLHANGIVSTSEARPEDWRDIIEICLNNREADFGGFLRRQLAGTTLDSLKELLPFISKDALNSNQPCDLAKSLLDEGYDRLLFNYDERKKTEPYTHDFLKYGSWASSLVINGDIPHRVADRAFLNLIATSNPGYTGWPPWLDTRSAEEAFQPRQQQDGWETLIVSLGQHTMMHAAEFSRIDPKGKFYLWRVIDDDLLEFSDRAKALTVFDPSLMVARVAEVMAVGLVFARAMGCAPEKTALAFAFKWTKLKNRKLTGWATPVRYVMGTHVANDDEVISCIEVPLETSVTALASFVIAATQDLFAKFNGFIITPNVVEDIVQRLAERRLSSS